MIRPAPVEANVKAAADRERINGFTNKALLARMELEEWLLCCER